MRKRYAYQVLMNKTIGSLKYSERGRQRFTLTDSQAESLWSCRHHQRSSPVFLRCRDTFCRRISGAYVSFTVSIKATPTPPRIRTIQLVHSRPRCSKTTPPIRGPSTGPLNGPRLYNDIPRASPSGFETSKMLPGPLATSAAANMPLLRIVSHSSAIMVERKSTWVLETHAKARDATTVLKDPARLHGITNNVHTEKHPM